MEIEMLNNISLSAQKVLANDDLLIEILLFLPVKPLLRFKSVSKRWLSLISDTSFIIRRNPDPCNVSGLFHNPSDANHLDWNENWDRSNYNLEFIPLKIDKKPKDESHFESITLVSNLSRIKIMSSLHGLWFCIGYDETKHNGGYHVLNPTTKQFVTLPNPHHDEAADKLELEGLHFAYDPLKSPHYKVVCIWSTYVCIHTYPFQDESYFQIEIYSSQTKTWRISGEKFTTIAPHTVFRKGVYWNGAINWLDPWSSIYFNVDDERIGDMPMVPIPEGRFWYDSQHLYYGESRGHLHFVEIYDPTVLFNVYELKKDYSEWFIKYRVDLATIANNFPEMTEIRGDYELLLILRDDDDDGSFMVMHMPNKFVIYNLVHKGYKVIYEYEGSPRISGNYYDLNIYPYIESLCDLC